MQLNPTYRDIWRVGWPVMLGNAAHGITQAVDTAFMARVGAIDLNGALLAGMTFFFLVIIALGFTRGTQILIARRTGENNYAAVGRVFDQMLLLGGLLTLAVVVMLVFFQRLALPAMIATPEILDKANTYLYVRQWSAPLVVLNLILIAFYAGIGKTKVITVATIVLSLINLVFDYLLIFGHAGFPEMGIAGAALATVLAEIGGSLILVGALFLRGDHRTFALLQFPRPDWQLYGKMINLSWPIVFQHMIGMGAWYLFFLMIEKISIEALAISSVIKSLYMVIGIPIWGLGSGVNTVVSNLLGQNRDGEVNQAAWRSVQISFCVSLAISTVIFLFPDFFIGLYSREITGLPDTLPTLSVTLAAMMLFSVGSMTMHTVMGIGDTRTLLLMESTTIVLYVTYCYLAVFRWELALPLVWMAEFVYWSLMLFMTASYLRFGQWKQLAARY